MQKRLDLVKHILFLIIIFSTLLLSANYSAYGQYDQHEANLQWLQQERSIASSTVLLNNKEKKIPVKDLDQKVASVNLGVVNAVVFYSLLNKYTTVTSFAANITDSSFPYLSMDLKFYNTVFVSVPAHLVSDKRTLYFLLEVQKNKNLIVVVYGSNNALVYLRNIKNPIIITPTDTPGAANFCAQLIFGGVPATAKLNEKFSQQYRKKDGYITTATRLKYSVPEDAGINISDVQFSVDTIVANTILGKGAPGAVVMVVKDGKVIFNKAYGSHTYDGAVATKITDIFDLASVTKVSAPTIASMRLYEQKKISLDSTFGYYIPTARTTNKANIKIRDLLLHQSGIAAGVALPILPTDVSNEYSAAYPVKSGNKAFIRKDYFNEVVWPRMLNVKLADTPKYVYSDLSMTYLKEVIEAQVSKGLDEYVANEFYKPLGMQSAGFNPLDHFDSARIVPTEQDTWFRKEMLRGYVHDPMAAKLGGVSGNAGLFSSANDLAILYQMVLNGGSYGGTTYFTPQTVNLFTTNQSAISRRGLGFDKVDTTSKLGYPSKFTSLQTYGHTGFTGTCFWVDPKHKLVYIFLSNRVYPAATNNLGRMRTQSKILDVFYGAINKETN